MKLTDFLDEFITALKQQLESDEKRWGNTWLERTKEGQEERAFLRFDDYYYQYKQSDVPIEWLKVAGGALICCVRDNHPELWNK